MERSFSKTGTVPYFASTEHEDIRRSFVYASHASLPLQSLAPLPSLIHHDPCACTSTFVYLSLIAATSRPRDEDHELLVAHGSPSVLVVARLLADDMLGVAVCGVRAGLWGQDAS